MNWNNLKGTVSKKLNVSFSKVSNNLGKTKKTAKKLAEKLTLPLKNNRGWSTIEYIAGAVIITTIVFAVMGIFRDKLETAVEDQVNFDFTNPTSQ